MPNLEVSNPNIGHTILVPSKLVPDRRASIQWWSSSDPTAGYISEAPNPARTFALNPYSVVAHKRNGVFFIGEDDPSVWHQVGGT